MNLARRMLTALAAWISGAPGWLGGALEAAGVKVGKTPSETAALMRDLLAANG